MRIRRIDLEKSILDKLDQFDNITNLPYINSDGFVSYNKDLGFYFKKTNDTYLKKLYSEDDFISMKDAIYNPKPNIKSSAYVDMREDKSRYSAAVSSLLVNAEYENMLDMADNIRIFKHYVNRFICLDISGNIMEISNNELKYTINILSMLKDTFALSELEPFDITDIELAEDGFLVSVLETGVYRYNYKTATLEMMIADSGIKMIKNLNEKKVFCVSDERVTIYMMDSGKKIETFYTIKNAHQIPFIMASEGRDIFVIGKTMIRNSDKLVHLWKEDIAKINYNNKDGSLSTHKSASEYEIKFISLDMNYLYISGLYKNKLFIWKYDRSYPHREPEEIFMDCLDFSNITGLVCYRDQYLVAIKDKIYGIQNNVVCLNMVCKDPIAKLELTEVGVIGISNNHLINLSIPKFEKAQEIITYNLLDETLECNNIDIFISGTDHGEKIELYDVDNKLIEPTAVFQNRGDTMIKLLNCHERVINMKLYVNPESVITGIAVKKNKIFVR